MCCGNVVFTQGLLIMVLLNGGAGDTVPDDLFMLAYKDRVFEYQDRLPNHVSLLGAVDISNQVLFYLHTNSSNSYDVLKVGDDSALENSAFDFGKPTKIIVHGWMDHVRGEMARTVLDGLLKSGEELNIITVDWGSIAITWNYLISSRKTAEVGQYIARMVDFLVSKGLRPDSVHAIGHSLGAHVVGEMGASLTSGKIARISGLDPALPGFGSLSVARRLQKTDADFVDCIHTCGQLLGIYDPICHADFYPNGGKFAMPGCSILDFGKCSHFRAFEYFAESATSSHKFPALSCDSVTSDNRKCIESPYNMGYSLNGSAQGSFYVYTNSKYPYAPVRPET